MTGAQRIREMRKRKQASVDPLIVKKRKTNRERTTMCRSRKKIEEAINDKIIPFGTQVMLLLEVAFKNYPSIMNFYTYMIKNFFDNFFCSTICTR